MRHLWCRWFHKKFHQQIDRNPPLTESFIWCWECEEEVK